MQTDRVPKGLALLKGFSVFNPDDAFVEEFKETWGVKLDFLDQGEKLLWIGAPDFRYSLVSFGQPILKYYFFPIFFIFFLSLILFGLNINPITVSASIVFFLIFSNILISAAMYFGITYGISNKRIFVLYVNNMSKKVTIVARINARKAKSTTVYYDIGYIYDMSLLILRGSQVGSLFFDKSINADGTPIKRKENKFQRLRERYVFFLQSSRNSFETLDHFTTIYNAKKVSDIIDRIRSDRLNAAEKIKML